MMPSEDTAQFLPHDRHEPGKSSIAINIDRIAHSPEKTFVYHTKTLYILGTVLLPASAEQNGRS